MPGRYQYKTVEVPIDLWTGKPKALEEELNKHARDGWKLVQIITANQGNGMTYVLIFENVW